MPDVFTGLGALALMLLELRQPSHPFSSAGASPCIGKELDCATLDDRSERTCFQGSRVERQQCRMAGASFTAAKVRGRGHGLYRTQENSRELYVLNALSVSVTHATCYWSYYK